MNNRATNFLRRFGCFVLSAIMLLSLCGCFTPPDDGEEDKFVIADPTKETYVVKNGVSPYKILIPENATDKIKFGASELQYFFKEITGVELEIVDKADNLQGKYFSLGATEIMKSSGVTNTYKELGMDGYRVRTYGDAVVMIGENDVSTCYAVYGYLAKQFGLEIYAEDIFRIYGTKEAKLIDVDWTELPDIPVRNGGGTKLSWYGSEKYMTRMHFRNVSEFWELWGHTYFTILPPSKYLAEHPDWYDDANDPLEICKTNAEMTDQFVENLKQIILEQEDHRYFMLGHEDGAPLCKCSDCQAVRDQYQGSNSALEVLFTNEVVRRINEWAAETIPDRELYFAMFAYTTTEAPPVEYDAATGKYSPINNDKKLIMEDNLGIQIAPISTPVSEPYLNQSYTANIFNGWAALTDNFYIWGYSAAFSNFIAPFDCFGSYEQNYRDYYELGAVYVFDQGSGAGHTPNFEQLRDYLMSKLMWDTSLNTDDLVRDFMKHYYGAGWEKMYQFYTLWRVRMTELREFGMLSYTAGQLVQTWTETSFYPKALLDQYEKLFDEALLANEALKETDPEMYIRYRDNIRLERCLVRYLSLSMYANYYDYDTYKAMIDEFKDITSLKNVNVLSHGSFSVNTLIAEWNQNLNNK